jgi:hypothetical protein
MSTVAVVVAVAVLVTGAVLFVAWPFASPDPEPPEQALSDRDRRVLELRERRDEAYAALHDLEQDVRTGKITPADYELERGRLRSFLCGIRPPALRELDGLSGPDPLR